MSIPKAMILIDGENIVSRYQVMIEKGFLPKAEIIHKLDEILWHPEISHLTGCDITRVGFYTTKTGSHEAALELADEIASIKYEYTNGFGYLNPHVFKKEKRSQKTKSVDINIVTDLLRHTYNRTIDEILLLSGDGDYIPTITESMRQGVRVSVGSFSSGLNKHIKSNVDEFFNLDDVFFQENI